MSQVFVTGLCSGLDLGSCLTIVQLTTFVTCYIRGESDV